MTAAPGASWRRSLARVGRSPIAAFLAVLALATFCMLLRRPASLVQPTIWAEDGREWLADAYSTGVPILKVYQGQLWTAQRLIAGPLSVFPVRLWPLMSYLAACALSTATLSVVLQQRAAVLFGRLWNRTLLLLALVFLPAATEIQGNLANLHLYIAISVAIILAMPTPTSRCGKVAELTYLVVAVLTGYLAIVLLPMAVWQAWRDRSSRFARLRAAILAVGSAVGVLVTLSYGRSANLADPVSSIVAFGWLVIRKISGSLVLGETNVSLLWPTRSFSPWFLLSLLLLVLVAFLVWRDRRGPSPLWLLTGLFWGALGVLTLHGAFAVTMIAGRPFSFTRYASVGVAMLVLITARSLRGGVSRETVVPLATAGLMITGVAGDAHIQAFDEPIPAAALAAFEDCLARGQNACTLPISPRAQNWEIKIQP